MSSEGPYSRYGGSAGYSSSAGGGYGGAVPGYGQGGYGGGGYGGGGAAYSAPSQGGDYGQRSDYSQGAGGDNFGASPNQVSVIIVVFCYILKYFLHEIITQIKRHESYIFIAHFHLGRHK